MMVWFWLLLFALALLELALLRRSRRQRRERLFLPLARRFEAAYRELVTTRVPLIELDAAEHGWRSKLPEPLLPTTAPDWAAAGAAAETYAAAKQFEADCAQLAGDLASWLERVAEAIAQAHPEPEIHAAAAADQLYHRLNGMPPEAEYEAGPPARLRAGKTLLAEGEAATVEAFAAELKHRHRELITSYLPLRERFTRLQVALDRLLYHLRALGMPPSPFGVRQSKPLAQD